MKDPTEKDETEIRCEHYRNLPSTLLKITNLQGFFHDKVKDLKDIWNETRKIVSLSKSIYGISSAITKNKL